MKKLVAVLLCVLVVLSLAACGTKDEPSDVADEVVMFKATVMEVTDSTMLVTPVDGSVELNSADLFSIPLDMIFDDSTPTVGAVYCIEYNGMIDEMYPATLGGISRVTLDKQG